MQRHETDSEHCPNLKLVKTSMGKMGHEKLDTYYKIYKGVLFRRKNIDKEEWRLCWPEEHIHSLISYIHLSHGHYGPQKCLEILQDYVLFNNMDRRVKKQLGACDRCQRVKQNNVTSQGEMQNILPKKVGELLAIDIFGPLPTSRGGQKYILLTVDVFSKFVRLYGMKKATSKTIIHKLELDYFKKHGKPKTLLSDNGSQFISKIWEDFMQKTDVKHIKISVYHPASNPAERYMRELGRLCRTYCSHNHKTWAEHTASFEDV